MRAVPQPVQSFFGLKNPTKIYGVRSRHGPVDVRSGDFSFSYAFDIADALFPGFSDESAINKLINKSSLSSMLLDKYTATLAGWTGESIRENFFKVVHTFVWKWIRLMVIRAANSHHEVQGTQPRVPTTSWARRKRRQTYDHDLGEFLVMERALNLCAGDGSNCSCLSEDGENPVDLHLLAEKEVGAKIGLFKAIQKKVGLSLKYLFWWAISSATRDLPFLHVVESAIESLKPGQVDSRTTLDQ